MREEHEGGAWGRSMGNVVSRARTALGSTTIKVWVILPLFSKCKENGLFC